jgi:hypothetical protein
MSVLDQVRFEHKGFSHIKITVGTNTIHFDPVGDIQENDVVILTWNWPEKITGTVNALQRGVPCKIIAPQSLLPFLKEKAALDVQKNWNNWLWSPNKETVPLLLSSVKQYPYIENKQWPFSEKIYRTLGAIKKPVAAVKQFYKKKIIPQSSPQISLLQWNNGTSLLHANLCFHQAQAQCNQKLIQNILESNDISSVDWMVVGCDYDNSQRHENAIIQQICTLTEKYPCKAILLTDLLNTSRQNWGFPTKLLTPICDTILEKKKLSSFVFASHSSFLFK